MSNVLDVSASNVGIKITKGDNKTFSVVVKNDLSVFDGLNTTYISGWNASTNSPTLTSSTGDEGNFYVVSTAGSTTLDGVSSWAENNWALFNGSVWVKVTDTYDITGSTIRFTVKDDAGTQIFQISTTSHTYPVAGVSQFTISDANWANVTADSAEYAYDIELELSGGAKHTLISGRIKIVKEYS